MQSKTVTEQLDDICSPDRSHGANGDFKIGFVNSVHIRLALLTSE